LGQIERKKLNEKIQFLRGLPFFSALTKTSIGKLTYQFKELNLIKNQILYREGDKVDFVYIIKSGQFEVTKTITE
jgi:CRP-like cAMP-binding protein